MTLFLDTNIVIDHLQQRQPFFQDVKNLLLQAIIQKQELIIAANSIDNIYYILSKNLPGQAVLKGIADFLTIASVASVDDAVIRRALKSGWTDFEDAIQYFAAMEAGANLIVTRDVKGYEEQKIKIVAPDAAVKLLIG